MFVAHVLTLPTPSTMWNSNTSGKTGGFVVVVEGLCKEHTIFRPCWHLFSVICTPFIHKSQQNHADEVARKRQVPLWKQQIVHRNGHCWISSISVHGVTLDSSLWNSTSDKSRAERLTDCTAIETFFLVFLLPELCQKPKPYNNIKPQEKYIAQNRHCNIFYY